MVYQTEKQLKEFEGKVPDDVKTKVEEKVTALREALKGEDLAAVKVPFLPFSELSMRTHRPCVCVCIMSSVAENKLEQITHRTAYSLCSSLKHMRCPDSRPPAKGNTCCVTASLVRTTTLKQVAVQLLINFACGGFRANALESLCLTPFVAFAMQSAQEALQQEAMAMGQSMYSQPGAEGAAGAAGSAQDAAGGGAAGSSDPNVVDAEFTDAGDKDSKNSK